MPGKSKKGGGLEVDTAFYLKSGNTTPFKQMGSSPIKAGFYDAVEYTKKNPYKVIKTGVKTSIKGALGTAGAVVGALYSFGKESIKRKKAGLSGFNLPKPPPKKDFAFSGSKTKDLRSKKTKEAETKEVLKKSEPGMEHKYDWKYDTKSKKNKGFNF